jgi:hypothetical protein
VNHLTNPALFSQQTQKFILARVYSIAVSLVVYGVSGCAAHPIHYQKLHNNNFVLPLPVFQGSEADVW